MLRRKTKRGLQLLFNREARQAYLLKRQEINEIRRIKRMPRYTASQTDLFGKPFRFLDKSFVANYEEIFWKEVYKFNTSASAPYIVDCGANVGLSVFYFKQRFPNAHIVAFEPDPNIFQALQQNVETFGFQDVDLNDKVVWSEETTVQFHLEGGSSSRIATDSDTKAVQTLETVSLRAYLDRPVDFLKIDIEGAEFDVLQSCHDLLGQVQNIFVEYHSVVGSEQKLGALLQLLSDAGFRYYIQHTGVVSSHPYCDIQQMLDMDLQLNIYGYRK